MCVCVCVCVISKKKKTGYNSYNIISKYSTQYFDLKYSSCKTFLSKRYSQ